MDKHQSPLFNWLGQSSDLMLPWREWLPLVDSLWCSSAEMRSFKMFPCFTCKVLPTLGSPPSQVIAGLWAPSPPPLGACMSAVPLAVREVGVTDSDFFTQDDPYQRQGDERQPRYLMGGCPAGKIEGKVATTTQIEKPARVTKPRCAQTHPHGTHCLQRLAVPIHCWYLMSVRESLMTPEDRCVEGDRAFVSFSCL